jgi:hypothetical protein
VSWSGSVRARFRSRIDHELKIPAKIPLVSFDLEKKKGWKTKIALEFLKMTQALLGAAIMKRAILFTGSLAVVVCFLACGGGGSSPTPGVPEEFSESKRLATSYKKGDTVLVQLPGGNERLICGEDLEAICEYHQLSILWSWENWEDGFKPNARPWERRLAILIKERRLVHIDTGREGTFTGQTGTVRKIDRSGIKMPPMDFVWLRIQLTEGIFYIDKTALVKR